MLVKIAWRHNKLQLQIVSINLRRVIKTPAYEDINNNNNNNNNESNVYNVCDLPRGRIFQFLCILNKETKKKTQQINRFYAENCSHVDLLLFQCAFRWFDQFSFVCVCLNHDLYWLNICWLNLFRRMQTVLNSSSVISKLKNVQMIRDYEEKSTKSSFLNRYSIVWSNLLLNSNEIQLISRLHCEHVANCQFLDFFFFSTSKTNIDRYATEAIDQTNQ